MDLEPAAALAHNLRVFETLVRVAHGHLRRGSRSGAFFYGTAAASWASVNHTGLFASAELEDLCSGLAGALKPAPAFRRRPNRGRQRVLHVLSETAEIGGHTRFVRRWVQNDPGRIHSVVLTRQSVRDIPGDLDEAVRATSGEISDLTELRDPLDGAEQLRSLAGDFDFVDACVHGDDLTPAVALADPNHRPPLIWLDHQDHKFWVGVAAADLVAEMSDVGLATLRDRRGVSFLRSALLPIPLQLPEEEPTKAEARDALRLPADGVVLLTVASPYKFRGTVRPRFAEATLEILRERQATVLVAIGPTPESDEAWATLKAAYPHRTHIVGFRSDPTPYYAAADVYLDSFPCGGQTASLEAGSHGLPIVSRRTVLDGPDLLSVDDPALRDTVVACADAAAWREAVLGLVDHPRERGELGKRTAERVAAFHGDRWISFLERIYDEATAQHVQREFPARPPGPRCEAIDVSLAGEMESWGWTIPLRQMLGHYSQFLDSDPLLKQLLFASIRRYERRGPWSRSSEEQLLDDQAGGGVLSIVCDPAGGSDAVLRCAPAG
jgi:glycosyltransferase involved in cell wall biosynthesis